MLMTKPSFAVRAVVLLCLYLSVADTAALPADNDMLPWQRMQAGKEMVTRYLIREARRLTDAAVSDFRSRGEWEEVRERRRLELLDMLGLDPLPVRTPLNVRLAGSIEKVDYTIEKLAFESVPGVFATANLYLPKSRSGPVPAVIYVCGHAVSPQGSKVIYQHHAITFARQGYACLIIDPIQIAETFALHHGVYNLEMPDWYARGYTPAGVEVWNVIRALDYLETRPEVDKGKFGITGRSGGAAMSWFSAAVDPRLKVVAPVMGNSTYAANVAANTQRGHCDCMFPINTYQHDLMTQGALIAPRPLYMMHGKQDTLFPVAGYEEFEARISTLYREYGAADKFKNTVVDTGHKDSDFLREEALLWFDRYLMQIPQRKIDLRTELQPAEKLAVFSGNPPPSALNFQVHELLTAASPKEHKTAAAWASRKQVLIEKLKSNVFRAFTKDAVVSRVSETSNLGSGGFRELSFESEPGIRLRTLYRGPAPDSRPLWPAVIYVASDGEDDDSIRRTLVQIVAEAKAVLILFPRGVGEVPWSKTTQRDMLRNAMHLGRTIDSMRLWDVMRGTKVLKQLPGVDLSRVTLIGKGTSGILGLYAAILDESIAQAVLMDPPMSHRQGPTFLNVLRYTDLPETAALLAPRRLVFYGTIPQEYRQTQSIYRLQGKGDNLSVSMSLKAVVNQKYDHNFSSGY